MLENFTIQPKRDFCLNNAVHHTDHLGRVHGGLIKECENCTESEQSLWEKTLEDRRKNLLGPTH